MKLYAGLLALALILFGVGPVDAASPAAVYNKLAHAGNPVATWKALSKVDRAAFQSYMTPARVTVASTKTPAGSSTLALGSCWKWGYVRAAYNALGVMLWSWTETVQWCGNAWNITDSTMREYGTTYVLFWSWKEQSHSLYVFRGQYPQTLDAFSQAEFKSCIFADIGCILYRYPWIDMDGDATGWHRWTAGG